MGNNTFIIAFVTIGLCVILGGFIFISTQLMPNNNVIEKKAIKCTNPESTISFLIDDENRTVIMAGEIIPDNTITIFNKTAVSAIWLLNNEKTKIFLDRIAGRLQIDLSDDFGNKHVEKFDCNAVSVRF
ncbi:MAG: hypothetical protein COA45_02255 [Zetaproteobacteria bacterium]|nr:MAG: hypothetical protein COA45_02255 [Zetaproteobacteria bacterium]